MERTQAGKILRPSLAQLHILTDDANDVRLLLKRFLEVGVGHGVCLGYRLPEELRQFVCVESCGNRVLKSPL